MRRARSWLGEDLDRLEQVLGDSAGYVKVQLCGPWTWASAVADRAGRRLVRDDGFMADLGTAFAQAASDHDLACVFIEFDVLDDHARFDAEHARPYPLGLHPVAPLR